MDNPEVERIQVNIKLVPKDDWEKGRKLSAKHGESMGATVGRALRQMYEQDSGPRELPPVNALTVPEPLRAISGNPIGFSGNPPIDRIALLTAVTALAAATQSKIPGASALAAEMVREARGLPPLPPRLTGPKRLNVAAVAHENGEARE